VLRRRSADGHLEAERSEIKDHTWHVEEHAGCLLKHVRAGEIKADGIDANGKPSHTEWSGRFDGKDYPVTGDPNSDGRSYTKVNERTLTTTNKKNGKVTVTGQIVVSPDGKTRRVTLTGTTPKGKKVKNVAVYDKQ
jgi:hypothetical protein